MIYTPASGIPLCRRKKYFIPVLTVKVFFYSWKSYWNLTRFASDPDLDGYLAYIVAGYRFLKQNSHSFLSLFCILLWKVTFLGYYGVYHRWFIRLQSIDYSERKKSYSLTPFPSALKSFFVCTVGNKPIVYYSVHRKLFRLTNYSLNNFTVVSAASL